ncbi:MAG TPA: hypothetical protein VI895_06285 [Bdellovibrionota bacterium]|nr:hypothetical protein [Bdellovibrionota bacterium]
MTTKQKIEVAVVIGFAVLFNANTYAEESIPKPKSVGVALALGLDPIPGDSLIYSGRPVQALGSFLLGAAGAGLIGLGVGLNAGSPSAEQQSAGTWIALGVMLYAPAYAWDLIGGVAFAKRHNAEIEKRKRTSFLQTLQPTLAVTPDGALAGARFDF